MTFARNVLRSDEVAYHPHLVARELAQAEDALFERAKALEASGGRRRAAAEALFAASREAGELRRRLEAAAGPVTRRGALPWALDEARAFLAQSRDLLR